MGNKVVNIEMQIWNVIANALSRNVIANVVKQSQIQTDCFVPDTMKGNNALSFASGKQPEQAVCFS